MPPGCDDPEDPQGPPRRRILLCGLDPDAASAFVAALAAGGEEARSADACDVEVGHRGTDFIWQVCRSTQETLETLAHQYVSAVVLDFRAQPAARPSTDAGCEPNQLLDVLDHPADPEIRSGFHRIIALIDGNGEAADRQLARLAARGVGLVLRQRSRSDSAFERRAGRRTMDLVLDRHRGKVAICAAGGGITGIYFEIGALKCLADCIGPGVVRDADLVFGISAGAVVTSVLRAGYSVDELMAAVAGTPGGRLAPLDLSLLRLGHLNTADIGRRLRTGAGDFVRGAWQVARGRARPSVDALLLAATALVGSPLQAARFEEMLRALLTAPGATNDFRDLPRPLFIGASNQDRREHVLFGSADHDHVPISLAVQASLSINPAFSAVAIDGTWYEDGAVTRTSDFREAVGRGADLVLVLDPFVPYTAGDEGTSDRRGVLYNIDQDVRALSFTRYQGARNEMLRRRPDVSIYTFLPSEPVRLMLSNNPMDHRPFLPICAGAYRSTFARLCDVRRRLRGDLVGRGLQLDLSVASAVDARLARAARPQLSDFYADGRIEIPRPPLIAAG